ncbi:MAG: protein-L-isoaspartate O-methyltransferase [Kiloniellaceae bacterium]
MTEKELAVVRRAFAKQILARAGVAGNETLERALCSVRREDFLGDDPWIIADITGATATLPSNDPVYAYQDVLFVLSSSRGANNGSPSLHARLLTTLAPQAGQRVAHIGAGTGYYSALLAQIVGPQGRVLAIEYDETLAGRAQAALRKYPNVEVIVDDAAHWPREEVDCLYVNFAVTAPQERWIEGLAPGGRLILPLGVPGLPKRPGGPRYSQQGAVFLFRREVSGFSAAHICGASFIHAEGRAGGDTHGETEKLKDAFTSSAAEFVRSLVWQRPADPGRCWLSTPAWSLSYDPV